MKTTALAAGTLLLLTLAACGKDQVDDTATDTSTAGTGAQGSTSIVGPPGASGEVADVSGRTMQVQNPTSGQVAVTWTAKTTFSQQVDASLKDVSVGDCVLVTSESASTSASTDAIAADTVRITPAMDGQCTPAGGRGAGPGQLMSSGPAPDGMPTGMPSGAPSDAPQRMNGSAGAFGTVTAVSAKGFTVDSVRPPAQGSTDSATASVRVTVTGDTSYTTTARATSSAVKVGVCVDARGDEDSTGAVTADTVSISPKVDGQCGSFGLGGPVFQQGA
jgi:hypothetical protein